MEKFSIRTTTALSLAVAAGLILCGLSQPAQAGDPAVACESSKLKAQGKYSACLKKADATAVKKGLVAADYTKCVEKITSAYTKAETKAAGACPSDSDLPTVLQILDAAMTDTTTGTGGGTYVVCGDGVIGGDESCDGTALGSGTTAANCVTLGFATGTLACTPGCGFDVSGCVSNPPDTCGNSLIDGNESCDGSALGGETCEGLGFVSGALGCTAGCGFDVSGCVAGGGGGLPATGQTTAYGPGSDGAIQAGCAQSYTDNGDGTITDNCTGLMWEKKDDSGGLHDMDNLYTWSGASAGSTNVMDGTIQDFIDELNDVAGGGASCFAGYCDWRVPNRNELATLVDNELPNGPTINTAFNQCPAGCSDVTDPACSCTSSSNYWSATTSAPYPTFAWGVHFTDAYPDLVLKSNDRHVRAVRSGS